VRESILTIPSPPSPVEVFSNYWEEEGAVLFETQKPSLRERRSILAFRPRKVLELKNALFCSRFFKDLEEASRGFFCLGFLGYDLRLLVEDLPDGNPSDIDLPVPNMPRDYYFEAVRKAHGYIAKGDIYQLNFTQRFSSCYRGTQKEGL